MASGKGKTKLQRWKTEVVLGLDSGESQTTEGISQFGAKELFCMSIVRVTVGLVRTQTWVPKGEIYCMWIASQSPWCFVSCGHVIKMPVFSYQNLQWTHLPFRAASLAVSGLQLCNSTGVVPRGDQSACSQGTPSQHCWLHHCLGRVVCC